jgi:hypothetical protein
MSKEVIESLLAEYDMQNSSFANDLREALAEQRADKDQLFIDSLPQHLDDKMFIQIDHWARQTYKHHNAQVRGTAITAEDAEHTHVIFAAFRWAKENGNPLCVLAEQPAPAQQEPADFEAAYSDAVRDSATGTTKDIARLCFLAAASKSAQQEPVAWGDV